MKGPNIHAEHSDNSRTQVSAHKVFSSLGHMLGHKARLRKLKKIENYTKYLF